MKKNFFYAMMSAIALTSAISFTACSSDDGAVGENNSTYSGEKVKTQFTISFPQNVASTRMAAAEVQATPTIANFRGMDFIKLIPFGINTPVTSSDTRIGSPIALAKQIMGSDATPKNVSNYINAADLTATSNSVLYQDVQIPVGTGAFLFYGKAIDGTTVNNNITSINDKFKFGTLTPSAALSSASTGAPTDITFTPVTIQTSNATSDTGEAGKIVEYLSDIASADGWANDASLQPLYNSFIDMKAGSSQAVADLIGDLLWSIRNNTSVVANNIRAKIYHGHNGPDNDGNVKQTGGDAACVRIAKAVINTTTGTYDVTLGSDCAGYPANNNLPEGAAQIAWDASNKEFKVVSAPHHTSTSGDLNVASLDKYVYPANLQYYVNSPAMVSQVSQKDKFNGTNTWNQILTNYTQGYVGVPTRSVVIKDPIQYGVGQLRMTVRTGSTTLQDNSDKIDTAPQADVTVPDGGIKVKGILIGGQRAVDWEFLPQTGTDLYTIYDNAIANDFVASKGDWSGQYNYTLVLETPVQEKVYIALELENNTGQTFYGQDNQKILPGRKFYLVGEIDPNNPAPSAITNYVKDHKTYWATGDPATKAAGNQIDQVFVQDYVTTLNLTINDLKKALNTIPDLRMPNMEFGLSVDLTWQTGLTFNVEL